MQVIVLDPTHAVARRAEQVLAAGGVGVVAVATLDALASPLAATTAVMPPSSAS